MLGRAVSERESVLAIWNQELADRFWSKVEYVDDPFGCMLWGAYRDPRGYGRFNISDRVPMLAHRVSWLLMVGEIPDGLPLDHLCRVPSCVSWLHLDPVTPRENTLRGQTQGAISVRTNRCKRGHEFTPDNTYYWSGGRACRTCCLARNAARRQRERTARLRAAA